MLLVLMPHLALGVNTALYPFYRISIVTLLYIISLGCTMPAIRSSEYYCISFWAKYCWGNRLNKQFTMP